MGEAVALAHPKSSLNNIGLEDALDRDVAALDISFLLTSGSRTVGHFQVTASLEVRSRGSLLLGRDRRVSCFGEEYCKDESQDNG